MIALWQSCSQTQQASEGRVVLSAVTVPRSFGIAKNELTSDAVFIAIATDDRVDVLSWTGASAMHMRDMESGE